MICIGKFTGEINADGTIGVLMPFGELLYARPCFTFPLFSVITKEWLDVYGDKFLAYVDFIDDLPQTPVLIGLAPLFNSTFPTEGLQNNTFLHTKNFRFWIDDVNNKCIIDSLNNGEILLGDKNVTEPGVLGNKLEDELTAIKTTLDSLKSSLQKIQSTLSSIGVSDSPAIIAASVYGIVLTYPTQFSSLASQLSLDIAQITNNISDVDLKISPTKSIVVKLK